MVIKCWHCGSPLLRRDFPAPVIARCINADCASTFDMSGAMAPDRGPWPTAAEMSGLDDVGYVVRSERAGVVDAKWSWYMSSEGH